MASSRWPVRPGVVSSRLSVRAGLIMETVLVPRPADSLRRAQGQSLPTVGMTSLGGVSVLFVVAN